MNCHHFLKLKKRLCPSSIDPPVAKINEKGELITEPHALKELYLKTYSKRLSHRDMKPELIDIYNLKMELWANRAQIIEKCKTIDWNHKCLKNVLTKLKRNKTIDPCGILN